MAFSLIMFDVLKDRSRISFFDSFTQVTPIFIQILIYRRSSRSGGNEEQLTVPFMSVCLSLCSLERMQPIATAAKHLEPIYIA